MQPTLTPQEIQRARELKQEGRTPQQIMGYLAGKRVNAPSTLSVIKKESEFAPQQKAPSLLSRIATDVPQDIASGIGNLGRDFQQRFGNMQETAQATLAGEQGVGQTALQLGGQIAGGFADTAFRTLQTAASLPLTQEAETAVGEAVGSAVTKVDNATGISNWYNTLDSKTQRNIEGALGFGELATIGLGKSITGQIMDKIKGAPKIEQLALPPKNMSYVANEATQGNIAPAVKVTNTVLSDSERTKVVNDFTEAYRSSLVENRQSINNKLEDIAKSASRGETVVTRDSLLRNLAEEGYVPEIEGRLAKFDSAFNDVQARKSEIMGALDRVLETATNKVSIDELYEMSRKALADNPQIVGGLARSQAELDRLFSSYRQKFGDELTARQVNQIRKESNELTRAFKDSDKFSADTASELGKVTREWLDNNVPDNTVRQANAEWARLNRLDETMQVLNNQQVDVGLLGRALGSYVTTVAGSTAGLAVGGPGGLVVAGLLAKIGGDGLADLIRRRIFDPETAAKVRQIMQSDRTLLQKLDETATNQANKNTLNDLAGFNIGEQLALPPARPDAPRSEVGSGAPIAMGGQTPTGRVEPGITERAVEGAVKQPMQTGFFKKQAERFKSPESFIKAVNDNPAWLAKLKAAGVTPEEIAKLTFMSVGALSLPLLLDEELSPLGFLVVGSIIGGSGARKAFAKKIATKVNEADLLEMSAFSGAYREGAFKTVNGEMKVTATKNFTQKEAQQALDGALRRAEDFPVISDASLGELAKTFDEVAEFAKID
jgi:hypothetical protein